MKYTKRNTNEFKRTLKTFINRFKKKGHIRYNIISDSLLVPFKLTKRQQALVLSDFENAGISVVDKDDTPDKHAVQATKYYDEKKARNHSKPKKRRSISASDPVQLYLREIGRYPLLSFQQEVMLDIRISKGDKQAKEKLAQHNLRLVVSVAKKFTGRGIDFLDLVQEGNLGLMKAVEKFDYRKGFKFSTYATWWIEQSVSRSIANESRTIRIPVHIVEVVNKLVRIQRQLGQDLKRKPTASEIAAELNVKPHEIRYLLRVAQKSISLETPVGEEQDAQLGDFVKSKNSINPIDNTKNSVLKDQLGDVLDTLTDREENVLRLRFGLDDGRERSLKEIGTVFGVTRERIRQIENKALRKMKQPSRSKYLKSFL